MLFITYYELNPDFDPAELTEVAMNIIKKGMLNPEGTKDLGNYLSPDYWGIAIAEIDNEEAAIISANTWRLAKPGIFKVLKSAVAKKMEEILPIIVSLKKKFKG
ncbi:MAG: hypothetical protein HWN66_11125 [Candidatus Helarchaeota archaeon]|nr:hypothetical protein [Candidatus Helarchaeota archaeon]